MHKLTRGTLKVIVGWPAFAEENDRRARAGGKIFVPPYSVFEYNEDLKTLDAFQAFSVVGKTVRPRTSINKFPYAWAPSSLRDVRLWLETRDELTLITNFNDEATNG